MPDSPLQTLRKSIGLSIAKTLAGYKERLKFSRLDDKLFRDAIFGFQRIKAHEVLIIDSPLFQRLRAITQTSIASLTYPSSVHTRFEHSINCVHIAEKVLRALQDTGEEINKSEIAEVRMAALLHDIGHCVFSHGSEFYYEHFDAIKDARKDDEFDGGSPNNGEIVNYCIITSPEFRELLWEPILEHCRPNDSIVDQIQLNHVAQMIIGKAPSDLPHRRYQTDIINGPTDVDKLDYMRRDGYFTGVTQAIDMDRLLPSLRVARHHNAERDRTEHRLVVDHRGISVVEQLLFARMILYDTVYHHHKVRASNGLLQRIFRDFGDKEEWPTSDKKLNTIPSLLEIDERDFFGSKYSNEVLNLQVQRLRYRQLPERALVLGPRTLVDKDSHVKWTLNWSAISGEAIPNDVKLAKQFFDSVQQKILTYAQEAGASDLTFEDIIIDVPKTPSFGRLGSETLILLSQNTIVSLQDLFPFQKMINSYTKQYKYRSYVFAPEQWRGQVAYGAFRSFQDHGIKLNNLALILAHNDAGKASELLIANNVGIPDWQTQAFVPDSLESA